MSLKGIRKSDGTAEYIYADDTLSEENAPGEAKAAGDRIAGVEGRITTLETAAPEIISNATKDWLDDNVTPTGSAVAIDSSLTQSGLAADAKAAGDAVNDLKSDIKYITELDTDNIEITNAGDFDGWYINNSGVIGSDGGNKGKYVACKPNTMYVYKRNGATGIIGVGYTNKASSAISQGLQLDGYKKDNSGNDIIIQTGNDSTYLLYYCLSGQIGVVKAYENVSHFIEVNTRLSEIENAIQTSKQIGATWSQGYIVSSNGNIGSDTTSCYTGIIQSDGNEVSVSVLSGYKFKIAEYDENTSFVGIKVSLQAQPTTFNIQTGHYFRIQVTKDSGNMTPAQVVGVITTTVTDYITKTVNGIVELEHGSYDSNNYRYSPSRDNFLQYAINKYPILVGDAEYISFNHSGTLIFRSSTGTSVSLRTISANEKVTIPASTLYVDIEVKESDLSSVNVVVSLLNCTSGLETTKRIYTNNGNRILSMFMVNDAEQVFTFANLLLPPNYNPKTPVPCILYLDGSGAVQWGNDFSSAKLPYLEYLRDEGFAIVSVFSWGNKYYNDYPECGSAMPYPVPTNLICIEKALDYICDRYSVDRNNIHIMSKSQGGQCALFYASRPINGTRSIGMFAPVLDYLSMPGEAMYADTRKALVDELELTGNVAYFTSTDFVGYSDDAIDFWTENLQKAVGFNEAWTNLIGDTPLNNLLKSLNDCKEFWTGEAWNTPNRTDIYNHSEYKKISSIPVKIWGASDDNQTPFFKMKEVVSQLLNAGTEAELHEFERGTGGHNCADLGTNVIASVTTSLGITYTDIPTGWVENIQWIRRHMAS